MHSRNKKVFWYRQIREPPRTGVYSYRTRRRFTDRVPGLLSLLVFAAPLPALPQDIPSHPKPGGEVCVATVSNMSARAALVDRLTERVSKDHWLKYWVIGHPGARKGSNHDTRGSGQGAPHLRPQGFPFDYRRRSRKIKTLPRKQMVFSQFSSKFTPRRSASPLASAPHP